MLPFMQYIFFDQKELFMVKKTKKKSSPAAKQRKQRKHTALHATLFAIVTVVIILALMIVELRPVKSVSSLPGPLESLALATVAGKFFAAIQQSNSRRESIQLTLSPAETHALLTMALRSYANEKKPEDPQIYAEWDSSGSMNAECSMKIAGMYFNFYAQIIPSVNQSKVYLQIKSCRLGKLPLPAEIVEKAVNSRLNEEISQDKSLKKKLSLIDSLLVEKSGEIQIKFLRKNSGKLLRSAF